MTTSAEIQQILSNYLAEAQRVVLQSSSMLLSDAGKDEVAQDIVGLANRDGGRVVLGISRQGVPEGKLAADHETCAAAVAEIASTRITPAIDLVLEHISGPEGELIVIPVPRRAAAPHAFARVSPKGSVLGRAFFVRHQHSTIPVSDEQLAWLFTVKSDPAIRLQFPLTVHLAADDLLPLPSIPQPRVADRFAAVLRTLSDVQRAGLGATPEALEAVFVELAPFVFLASVREILAAAPGTELEYRAIPLSDVSVPGNRSVFGALPGGLRQLLNDSGMAEFALPRGADLQIDTFTFQRKSRLLLSLGRVHLTVSVAPGGTGAGLAWADDPGTDGSLRWVGLEIDYSCGMEFPVHAVGPGGVAARIAEAFRVELNTGWNSERLRRGLSQEYLERITGDPLGAAP